VDRLKILLKNLKERLRSAVFFLVTGIVSLMLLIGSTVNWFAHTSIARILDVACVTLVGFSALWNFGHFLGYFSGKVPLNQNHYVEPQVTEDGWDE